jgi:hypothetical protein
MLARSSRLFGIALGLGALVLSAASCDKESAKTTTVAKHRPVARRASASAQQLAHRAKAAPEARAKATPPAAGDRDPFARPSLERPPVTQLRCEGHVALREHGLSELELTAVARAVCGLSTARSRWVGRRAISTPRDYRDRSPPHALLRSPGSTRRRVRVGLGAAGRVRGGQWTAACLHGCSPRTHHRAELISGRIFNRHGRGEEGRSEYPLRSVCGRAAKSSAANPAECREPGARLSPWRAPKRCTRVPNPRKRDDREIASVVSSVQHRHQATTGLLNNPREAELPAVAGWSGSRALPRT